MKGLELKLADRAIVGKMTHLEYLRARDILAKKPRLTMSGSFENDPTVYTVVVGYRAGALDSENTELRQAYERLDVKPGMIAKLTRHIELPANNQKSTVVRFLKTAKVETYLDLHEYLSMTRERSANKTALSAYLPGTRNLGEASAKYLVGVMERVGVLEYFGDPDKD